MFHSYSTPIHLLSFPTRRSSDLAGASATRATARTMTLRVMRASVFLACESGDVLRRRDGVVRVVPAPSRSAQKRLRSEEHTSELQSHSDLVCRLLLEKKKNNTHW